MAVSLIYHVCIKPRTGQSKTCVSFFQHWIQWKYVQFSIKKYIVYINDINKYIIIIYLNISFTNCLGTSRLKENMAIKLIGGPTFYPFLSCSNLHTFVYDPEYLKFQGSMMQTYPVKREPFLFLVQCSSKQRKL